MAFVSHSERTLFLKYNLWHWVSQSHEITATSPVFVVITAQSIISKFATFLSDGIEESIFLLLWLSIELAIELTLAFGNVLLYVPLGISIELLSTIEVLHGWTVASCIHLFSWSADIFSVMLFSTFACTCWIFCWLFNIAIVIDSISLLIVSANDPGFASKNGLDGGGWRIGFGGGGGGGGCWSRKGDLG